MMYIVSNHGAAPLTERHTMTSYEKALSVQLQRKNRAIIAALIIGFIIGATFIGIISVEPVWIEQVAESCQM